VLQAKSDDGRSRNDQDEKIIMMWRKMRPDQQEQPRQGDASNAQNQPSRLHRKRSGAQPPDEEPGADSEHGQGHPIHDMLTETGG